MGNPLSPRGHIHPPTLVSGSLEYMSLEADASLTCSLFQPLYLVTLPEGLLALHTPHVPTSLGP